MARITLQKLHIENLGPINNDDIDLERFTYFIGRNNAGKSHFLKAIELLLASKAPSAEQIKKFQRDETKDIVIDGFFHGVQDFTHLLKGSNHKGAIDAAIKDGVLKVRRVLSQDKDRNALGIPASDGSISNPSGFQTNLLKVLPDVISIEATADTTEELKSKADTALSKLKKETMGAFFQELKEKTKSALATIDEFLHSETDGVRSQQLQTLEASLKEELMGEFAEVNPEVEFDLPDEETIAREMKIILDDGHRCEVEHKGHGLQRATLLALLRVLAKKGVKYQDSPAPIFLIGELETFLHPFAQKQLAGALNALVDQYQIITTTHSPFIISVKNVAGYRRVLKSEQEGSKAIASKIELDDLHLIKKHLERRGNLEGLFADRIVLIEGDHDEGFFSKLRTIFNLSFPPKEYGLFVKTAGKDEMRLARKFYLQMGFSDVSLVCDLDYLFSNQIGRLMKDIGLDSKLIEKYREHIQWTDKTDPSLEEVISRLKKYGEPAQFGETLSALKVNRIFILRHGSPEVYYVNEKGKKSGWEAISSEKDLQESVYLKDLMSSVLAN